MVVRDALIQLLISQKEKLLKSCKSYQASSSDGNSDSSSDGITYNDQGCCNRVRISNQINYDGEYEMIYDENRTWKIERLRLKNPWPLIG